MTAVIDRPGVGGALLSGVGQRREPVRQAGGAAVRGYAGMAIATAPASRACG